MKTFTKIIENQNNEKYFEVSAEIKLLIKTDNEGEAGYIGDSILASIKDQITFTIKDISEVSSDQVLEMGLNLKNNNTI